MPSYSDLFYPTRLSTSLNANTSDNIIQVDVLDADFVDKVQGNHDRLPLRLGRGQDQERVLITGINDAANNKLDVQRNAGPYGLKSHPSKTRVSHVMEAWVANKVSGLSEAQSSQDAEIQTLRAAIDKLEQRVTTLENA